PSDAGSADGPPGRARLLLGVGRRRARRAGLPGAPRPAGPDPDGLADAGNERLELPHPVAAEPDALPDSGGRLLGHSRSGSAGPGPEGKRPLAEATRPGAADRSPAALLPCAGAGRVAIAATSCGRR